MVRLKGYSIIRLNKSVVYFNTNMVRLKVEARFNTVSVVSFQYQYGAIKGENPNYSIDNESKFQYQYGAIKGIISQSDTTPSEGFQYQYGAIKGSISSTGRALYS